MDTADLHPLVEDLTSNIDELEESLAPLLKTAVSHSTSKLPLLDKAKLYVLATYAIESILFSYLRLNGVDAKSHPVFQELTRVKEYFAKIKTAETVGVKRNTTLDREAASRFIKHGLAGNEKYDRGRQEHMAREKAGAKRKLEDMQVGTHTRFDGAAKRIKAAESEAESSMTTNDEKASKPTTDTEASEHVTAAQKSHERKASRRRKKLASAEGIEDAATIEEEAIPVAARGSADEGDVGVAEVSHKAPEASEAALESLVGDQSPKPSDGKRKKKKKSKGQKLEDERADEMK